MMIIDLMTWAHTQLLLKKKREWCNILYDFLWISLNCETTHMVFVFESHLLSLPLWCWWRISVHIHLTRPILFICFSRESNNFLFAAVVVGWIVVWIKDYYLLLVVREMSIVYHYYQFIIVWRVWRNTLDNLGHNCS